MLQPMQEPDAANTPSATTANFASLLAALTAPAPKPATEWNEDGLAEDIATLSYEQALRTHTRYRSAQPDNSRPIQHGRASSLSGPGGTPHTRTQGRNSAGQPKAGHGSTVLEKNRKSASITIRLSREEGAQLRERAAEAGLTVSAYLRSCIFEAESLRAQVKEALVQLRASVSADEKKPPSPATSSSSTWRARLFPRWSGNQGTAHA